MLDDEHGAAEVRSRSRSRRSGSALGGGHPRGGLVEPAARARRWRQRGDLRQLASTRRGATGLVARGDRGLLAAGVEAGEVGGRRCGTSAPARRPSRERPPAPAASSPAESRAAASSPRCRWARSARGSRPRAPRGRSPCAGCGAVRRAGCRGAAQRSRSCCRAPAAGSPRAAAGRRLRRVPAADVRLRSQHAGDEQGRR